MIKILYSPVDVDPSEALLPVLLVVPYGSDDGMDQYLVMEALLSLLAAHDAKSEQVYYFLDVFVPGYVDPVISVSRDSVEGFMDLQRSMFRTEELDTEAIVFRESFDGNIFMVKKPEGEVLSHLEVACAPSLHHTDTVTSEIYDIGYHELECILQIS